jgi:hypothetical protein
VSKGLIALLVLAVLIVVIFWIVKSRGKSTEKSQIAEGWVRESYDLWCPDCQKTFTITRQQYETLPKQDKPRRYQCPECKKFVATFNKPKSDVITVPDEGGGG